MLIVDHRRNEIAQLQETSCEFGVEIDLRNHGDDILVTHDAFVTSAPRLEQWLASFHHRFLIANVKEEGMEAELLRVFKERDIESFFILDESIPFIRKHALTGMSKFAIRVSEFEDYHTATNLARSLKLSGRKVDWIWADSFTGEPLAPEVVEILHEAGFKICAVSPELHHVDKPFEWSRLVSEFHRRLQEPRFMKSRPDMICTKLPEEWKRWNRDHN